MLHARNHFLTHIAALAEGEAAVEIHQHIMREGILKRVILWCRGKARLDAKTVIGFP